MKQYLSVSRRLQCLQIRASATFRATRHMSKLPYYQVLDHSLSSKMTLHLKVQLPSCSEFKNTLALSTMILSLKTNIFYLRRTDMFSLKAIYLVLQVHWFSYHLSQVQTFSCQDHRELRLFTLSTTKTALPCTRLWLRERSSIHHQALLALLGASVLASAQTPSRQASRLPCAVEGPDREGFPFS